MVLERLLSRHSERLAAKYTGFKSDYVGSDIFAYSQATTTVFWILSAIAHNAFDPIYILPGPTWIDKYFLQISFSILALITLIFAFPYYHYRKSSPFRYQVDWYPMAMKPRVHKEKWRDNLGLVREGEMRIVTSTKILEDLDEYNWELETSDPSAIDFTFLKWSDDQNRNRDRTRVNCESVKHGEFINILSIEKNGQLGGGTDHYAKIIDVTNDEPHEVLKLEVRE